MYSTLLTTILVFFCITGGKEEKIYRPMPAKTICSNMFKQAKEIKTLSFTMKKTERFNDAFICQIAQIKFCKNPFQVYLRQKSPKDGLEVLYNAELNTNEALINPNGFPWINLGFDPLGKTMRENQHHTLFESGFDYVSDILSHLINKYETNIDTMMLNTGLVVWKGRTCWRLEMKNPFFKYQTYRVLEGESTRSIAKKFMISEYMIVEKNKQIHHFGKLKTGLEITIPNDYSPKMKLYVDKEKSIPILMKIYDEKGLYEQYEYTNVVINPPFSKGEFLEDFKEYDF
jgi:outer membrane lipoprotein-sorting protein